MTTGKLDNKIALVTGASKGIGAGIAKQLAAQGATVIVNYATSKDGAARVVDAILAAGGNAVAIGGDVSNEADIAALFADVKQRYGRLDILVNNAGVYAFAPLEAITAAEFHRIYDTNVLGLLLVTQAAAPLFPRTGGSILNISSVVSAIAPTMAAVYASTKGAVDTITKVLAKELAPRNIRVNAINPGLIMTEGTQTAGILGSNLEKAQVAITPLGRAGKPDDIALPAVFLASDDAKYITGETLFVTGGSGV